MGDVWPKGFPRIPDQSWTHLPIDELARKYDSVESHGWYQNLVPTVDELIAHLSPGQLICDYSGGTGILADWLFRREKDLDVGIVIADSSPKFLRLALEKHRNDARLAFRQIEFLKQERRLRLLDEALDPPLVKRGLDGLVSTNAVHLYYDLDDTVQSWRRCLRPGAKLWVQSGNIRNPSAPAHSWIIDETVEAIHDTVRRMVREHSEWSHYRDAEADVERMRKYDALRKKYFLPVRPLDHYVDCFRHQGFEIDGVRCEPIAARVLDWFEFLAAYHEGVLGWVGGTDRIDGKPATAEAVRERLSLMKAGLNEVLDHSDSFEASWTYITCHRR